MTRATETSEKTGNSFHIIYFLCTFNAAEVKQASPICPIGIIFSEAYCLFVVYNSSPL